MAVPHPCRNWQKTVVISSYSRTPRIASDLGMGLVDPLRETYF